MPQWMQEWWPLVAILGPVLVGWVWWSARQRFADRDWVSAMAAGQTEALRVVTEKLEKAVADERQQRRDLGRQVDKHQAVLEQMPTKDDFHALHLKLTETGGRLDAISQELKSVGQIAKRLEDFELQRSRA